MPHAGELFAAGGACWRPVGARPARDVPVAALDDVAVRDGQANGALQDLAHPLLDLPQPLAHGFLPLARLLQLALQGVEGFLEDEFREKLDIYFNKFWQYHCVYM